MNRASEVFHSLFVSRYGSTVCAAALAALTICVPPKASAQTYTPSSVSCISGGNGLMQQKEVTFEAQDTMPADPSQGNQAALEADASSSGTYPAAAECTWKGFGSGTTTSAKTLSVSIYFGGYGPPAGDPDPCGVAVGYLAVTSSGYFWSSTCNVTGPVVETYTVPSGTNLATFFVTAETRVDNTSLPSNYSANLIINSISIH